MRTRETHGTREFLSATPANPLVQRGAFDGKNRRESKNETYQVSSICPLPSPPQASIAKPGWSRRGISQPAAHPLSPPSPRSMRTQRDAPPLPGGSSPPEGKLSLLRDNSIQACAQGGRHPSAQRNRARVRLMARQGLVSIHPLGG